MRKKSNRKTSQRSSIAYNKTKLGNFDEELSGTSSSSVLKRNNNQLDDEELNNLGK
jgi:hypothetical protein